MMTSFIYIYFITVKQGLMTSSIYFVTVEQVFTRETHSPQGVSQLLFYCLTAQIQSLTYNYCKEVAVVFMAPDLVNAQFVNHVLSTVSGDSIV